MSNSDICLGCMNPKGSAKECPKCGYIEGTPQVLPALAPGTVLAKRYLVGKRLHSNGEGISYIGLDQQTNRKVVVREFLPASLCKRTKGVDTVRINNNADLVYKDYMSDFIEVSRAVGRLSDCAAIQRVLDIFECNNTAYAVYEYIAGKPLSELVRRANRLTWSEAQPLFIPLISAMISAHSIGLVHFGLNPENIIMTRSGNLVITGFGVPDARIIGTELKPDIMDGFGALEQYSIDSKKGKWTDVYSMCAVILYALTGKCPPSAVTRTREPRLDISSDIADNIPAHVMTALAGGLQVHGEKRTPGMEQLRAELSAGGRGNLRSAAGSAVASAVGRVRSRVAAGGDKDPNLPWYMNLSQFQYWMLATGLGILLFGTIAVIVFLNVRSKLRPDDSRPAVVYVDTTSDSDVSAADIELFPVPDFVGKKMSDGLQDEYYAFMLLENMNPEYSDDYDVGIIMRQSVPSGSQVPSGTPICLTVSLGSKMCAVPNILGMTVYDASNKLSECGLVLGQQTESYDDSVPAGRIISISGASVGNKFERGSSISVVVSLGPEM